MQKKVLEYFRSEAEAYTGKIPGIENGGLLEEVLARTFFWPSFSISHVNSWLLFLPKKIIYCLLFILTSGTLSSKIVESSSPLDMTQPLSRIRGLGDQLIDRRRNTFTTIATLATRPAVLHAIYRELTWS
jgi:hypothetical protein